MKNNLINWQYFENGISDISNVDIKSIIYGDLLVKKSLQIESRPFVRPFFDIKCKTETDNW